MKYGIIKAACGATSIRVADCEYNKNKIVEAILSNAKNGVELLFLPELCITGSSCQDLFFQKKLLIAAEDALNFILNETRLTSILSFIGLPYLYNNCIYNCIAVINRGQILGIIPQNTSNSLSEKSRYFANYSDENTTVLFDGNNVPFGNKLVFQCAQASSLVIGAFVKNSNSINDIAFSYVKNGATIIGQLSAEAELATTSPLAKTFANGESLRLSSAYCVASAGEGESTTDCAFSGHSIISLNGEACAETKAFSKGFAVCDIDTEKIANTRMKKFIIENNNDFKVIEFNMPIHTLNFVKPIARNPFLPTLADDIPDFCNRILTICAHSLAKRMAHVNAKTALIGISGGLDSCLALLVTVKAFTLLNKPLTDIIAVTMPCFGTSEHTKTNAQKLCAALGVSLKEINIRNSVLSHFNEIEHDQNKFDVTFENAQARMRTLVLMDLANSNNGLVVGTGDLSELALGFATFGGDHISNYSVNAGIPKTIIRIIVGFCANNSSAELGEVLHSILQTPISPELLPLENNNMAQITEDLVGPYELHDFFLYYVVYCGFEPEKVFALAKSAFYDTYDQKIIFNWLSSFYRRFFSQQFKRSCMPDGPQALCISLSPRGGFCMPSDACSNLWLTGLDRLKENF